MVLIHLSVDVVTIIPIYILHFFGIMYSLFFAMAFRSSLTITAT